MQALDALREALPRLPARDHAFASDLLSQASRRGLTDKQMYWVRTLAERAGRKQPGAPVQLAAGCGRIVALLTKAAAHLKRPSIVLDSPLGPIRVAIAGSRSRYEGQVMVTSQERELLPGQDYPQARYFGRVTPAGQFMPGRDCTDAEGLGERLARFAADPAGEARTWGRLHGRCCFCNRPLRDTRSTEVGYGPDCADNYGLDWG